MITIYTLIFTATSYVGFSGAVAVHTQHDYRSLEACHQAYDIASKQASSMGMRHIQGSCLKYDVPKEK